MKTELCSAFGCPSVDLLREFCSYDILCPECCDFVQHPRLDLIYTISPITGLNSLHWSRQFEYPWAILNSNFCPNDVCLEAGGGYAPFKYALAKRCKTVVSVDIDKESQMKAFKSTIKMGLNNIYYLNESIQDLKYEEKFDKIYCLSVLEHIEDEHIQRKCIENMFSLLKPGGEMFISFDISLKPTNGNDFYIDTIRATKLLREYFNTELDQNITDQYVAIDMNGHTITAVCLKVWDT